MTVREPVYVTLPTALSEPERLATLQRWRARTRALGGDAWRISTLDVGLVLPEGHEVRGARRLRDRAKPCTVGA